jgi:XTP/dITP diphosphohydrolase
MNRRLSRGERLVLASHNRGKLREIAELVGPFGVEAVSAIDLGLAEPDETEPDFAGNARLKALAAAMQRVHTELGAAEDRRAWFVCALCLAWPDGETATYLGRVEGTLAWPPRGTLGFGYDPMFVPGGGSQTYGEIDQARKHATSHRARAMAQLVAACLQGEASQS